MKILIGVDVEEGDSGAFAGQATWEQGLTVEFVRDWR